MLFFIKCINLFIFLSHFKNEYDGEGDIWISSGSEDSDWYESDGDEGSDDGDSTGSSSISDQSLDEGLPSMPLPSYISYRANHLRRLWMMLPMLMWWGIGGPQESMLSHAFDLTRQDRRYIQVITRFEEVFPDAIPMSTMETMYAYCALYQEVFGDRRMVIDEGNHVINYSYTAVSMEDEKVFRQMYEGEDDA